MERLRTQKPELFFQIVKETTGLKKSLTLAKAFKNKIDANGDVELSMSFENYLQKLYYKNEDSLQSIQFIKLEEQDRYMITDEDLEYAFERMKLGKAQGVDGLQDRILVNMHFRKHLSQKLKQNFQSWLDGGEIPGYLTENKIFPISKQKGTSYPEVG